MIILLHQRNGVEATDACLQLLQLQENILGYRLSRLRWLRNIGKSPSLFLDRSAEILLELLL